MTDLGNSPASRDIANVLHPYTNLVQHAEGGPHLVEQGRGIFVYDDNGKEYIEGLAGLWCTSFGFQEDELIKAAVDQMKKLPYYHIFAGKGTNPSIDLAEKLLAIAPTKLSKVFFANSGSEANDTMIKMVWYYNNALGRPEKKKVISRLKGYHGVTIAAGSLTGLPYVQQEFDLPLDRIKHTTCPHYYHGGEPGESEEDFASRMAADLEAMIQAEGPETVAAFIAEPVMGAGGVLVPPKTYFQKIQAVLKKHDVLMVADEVICGFGRTGNMWGSETFEIKPDILTCAKALSSAYLPISAVLINDDMFQAFERQSEKLGIFGHGFTYTGHPVCAAVAVRTLELMEEREILAHVRRVSPRFQSRLMGFAEHPLVGETRGVGLIGAVELSADKEKRQSFDPALKMGPRLADAAQQEGLIVRSLPGDAVAFCPPLIITEEQIDDMFDRFGRALDRFAQESAREAAE
ncbi:MAG: aspartate aminotransferase family protein [Alphaproteobacteria bacterium]|nr:aspartate aminotransferase family protein [Alphaproteobacteria bacterium]